MDVFRMAAGALLIGAAVAAGLWVAAELQNPVSDLRLWLAGVKSNLGGES